MKNNQVLKVLEQVLADSYALTIKTKNYHWNVVGDNFKALHEMFDAQYQDLSDAIDEIAERIRALGVRVEASLEYFSNLSQIKKGDETFDAKKMLQDLAADHHLMINLLKSGIVTAQKEGDEGTADIFIQRSKVHEKTLWMIESSL